MHRTSSALQWRHQPPQIVLRPRDSCRVHDEARMRHVAIPRAEHDTNRVAQNRTVAGLRPSARAAWVSSTPALASVSSRSISAVVISRRMLDNCSTGRLSRNPFRGVVEKVQRTGEVSISAFVPEQDIALLDAWRLRRGWSRSAAIREAIRRMTAPKGRATRNVASDEGGQHAP